jgi:hypothetical protein
LLAGVLSLVAATQPAAAAEAWVQSTIKNVYPFPDGSFVLVLNTATTSCTNPALYYYVMAGQNSVTAEGVKALLASSLAAAAQSREISMAFDNATTACYVNRFAILY